MSTAKCYSDSHAPPATREEHGIHPNQWRPQRGAQSNGTRPQAGRATAVDKVTHEVSLGRREFSTRWLRLSLRGQQNR